MLTGEASLRKVYFKDGLQTQSQKQVVSNNCWHSAKFTTPRFQMSAYIESQLCEASSSSKRAHNGTLVLRKRWFTIIIHRCAKARWKRKEAETIQRHGVRDWRKNFVWRSNSKVPKDKSFCQSASSSFFSMREGWCLHSKAKTREAWWAPLVLLKTMAPWGTERLFAKLCQMCACNRANALWLLCEGLSSIISLSSVK